MKKTSWALMMLVALALVVQGSEVRAENPNESDDPMLSPSPMGGAVKAVGTWVVIPVGAFVNDGNGPNNYFILFGSTSLYATAIPACMTAPVVFPEGAKTITGVYVYAKDTNAGNSETFQFRRGDLAGGTQTILGSVPTADSSDVVKYTIPVSETNIQSAATYQITVCMQLDISIYGAIAKYAR